MKMRKARTYAPGTGVAYSVRAPALRRYYLGSQQVPSQHSWCLSRRLYRYLLPPTHPCTPRCTCVHGDLTWGRIVQQAPSMAGPRPAAF
jgi:hypothetical protein